MQTEIIRIILKLLIKTVLIVFKKDDIAAVTDYAAGILADTGKSKSFKTDINVI